MNDKRIVISYDDAKMEIVISAATDTSKSWPLGTLSLVASEGRRADLQLSLGKIVLMALGALNDIPSLNSASDDVEDEALGLLTQAHDAGDLKSSYLLGIGMSARALSRSDLALLDRAEELILYAAEHGYEDAERLLNGLWSKQRAQLSKMIRDRKSREV